MINYSKKENGVALIITIVILNLILVGTLVISKIFTGEIQNSRILYQSTAAYYAAESGIEYMLYDFYKSANSTANCTQLNNININCQEIIDTTVPNITTTTIISTGSYDSDKAKRRIEAKYTKPTP